MLPALPRSYSATRIAATTTTNNNGASLSATVPDTPLPMTGVSRQASAPSAFNADAAAAMVDSSTAAGAVGDARGAAAGGGCAAAKARRESRNTSAMASLNGSYRSLSTAGGHAEGDHVEATADSGSGSAPRSDALAPSAETTPVTTHVKGPLADHDDATSPARSSPSCDPSGASGGRTPSQSAGGNSVDLLHQMQQLLQEGTTPEMLQRWVARQLQQQQQQQQQLQHPQSAMADAGTPPPYPTTAPHMSAARDAEGHAIPTPTHPRRPVSAVSFSLVSANPASFKGSPFHAANVQSPVTPQLLVSDDDVALVPTPPSQPSPPVAIVAPRTGSFLMGKEASPLGLRVGGVNSNSTSSGNSASGTPTTTAPHTASSLLALTSPRRIRSSPGRHSTPPLPDTTRAHQLLPGPDATYESGGGGDSGSGSRLVMYPTNAAGRRRSLSVTSPTPNNASPAANAAAATPPPLGGAAGVGSGLLKAPRAHTPGQQQWRSFRRSGSASEPGAHHSPNTAGGAAATSPPSTMMNTTVAASRRAQETSTLHEVTKAALHATTSRVVVEDQRSITLMMTEHFSRNAEPFMRRLATPPSSRSTTLALPIAAAQESATSSARRPSMSGAADSCLPSALYDRADMSTTSSQARSPTLLKGVATVPLGMGANLYAASGAEIVNDADDEGNRGPLPTYPRPASSDEVGYDKRVRELVSGGSNTRDTLVSGPTASERSNSIDISSTSTCSVAMQQPSTTPPAAAIPRSGSAGRGHRVSPLTFAAGKAPHTSGQSSESVPTLPSSVPGTVGTLTCEQDALFPQPSPLASPAVSPMTGTTTTTTTTTAGTTTITAAATNRSLPPSPQHYQSHTHSHAQHPPLTLRMDGHRNLSPHATGVGVTTTPDTPLTTADAMHAEELPSPTAAAVKRTTLANVIPLIDVVADSEDTSVSAATTGTDSFNTSSLKGNVAATQESQRRNSLRKWGVAATANAAYTNGFAAASANAGNYAAAATLPAVNTSAASQAWMQSSLSTGNATSSEYSPLSANNNNNAPTSFASGGAANAAGYHHNHHRTTQAYARVASFMSNASGHIGGANHHSAANIFNTSGFGAHSSTADARSFVSLGDDMQSFNSSRVSCAPGGLNGGHSTTSSNNNPNRLRRSSVLHLSHTSINGGIDPLMDGVMPDFVLDGAASANRRPGPRFLRTYCRHTPVHVPVSVTQELLAELDVPYLEDIDEASNPTNIFTIMDNYHYRDARAFYVVVCLNVLLRYHLVRRFAWDTQKLKRFLEVAASFFRDGNPFHHPVHAADVVLAAHQWLSEGTTAASLSDGEVSAFLLTAVSMELAHTGVDNRLLTQLRHPYAMLCSFTSPQQGASVALVMALLRYPELHFFPDPDSADAPTTPRPTDPSMDGVASKDTVPPGVAHEWTASQETQLYDMLSELIMATDVRNHVALRQAVSRMAEENWQRHGCLCANAATSKPYGSFTAPRPSRNRQGAGAAAAAAAAAATTTTTTAASGPATTPKKFNASASSFPSPVPQGGGGGGGGGTGGNDTGGNDHVCLNCCAYITENHVPDVLKAVLHDIDYSFLFRPHDIYVTQSIMYVAELYRQSEVEYRLLQRQQHGEKGGAKAMAANTANNAASPVTAAAAYPSAGAGAETQQTDASGRAASTKTAFPATDLEDSAATFASALMGEPQPWRQEMYRASTKASLQRRGSSDGGSASPSRRATTTINTANGALINSPFGTQQTLSSHGRSNSDEMASTDTTASPQSNSAVPPKSRRVQPLGGHGRDIMLISMEDICLPYLGALAPYLPEAWVWATYLNHQTFLLSVPPPEEFDAAVNRVLDLADETEEDIALQLQQEQQQQQQQGAEGNSVSSMLPWLLIRRICPCKSEWTMNKDGLVRRVVKEVVRETERLLDVDDV